MPDAAPAVRLIEVTRRFGSLVALDRVGLEIRDAEFFAMLGPSGSGKTTCLRLIAGFDHPDAGRIELHGIEASRLPPYDRDVNTVFQDYALFPHMTVAGNVGYGLMVRGVAKRERNERVAEMLDLVRLPGIAERRPAQLSGGQRQRVALARALVNRPRVLLLDEPLGALDLKLRQQMQVELKQIQERLGITFVHVTHDQEEALALADRLAVFRDGRIEQVGTAAEVYESPTTAFVADFVGTSNVLEGELAQRLAGSPESFSIRPERVRMAAWGHDARSDPAESCSASGRIADVVYLGSHTRYIVDLDGARTSFVVVELSRETSARDVHARRGERVQLSWSRAHNRPLRRAP